LPAAVLTAAVYSFFVLVLPARGLTFLWDDWEHLYQLGHDGWPHRWFVPSMEHWVPIYLAVFDLERLAFGLDHTFFVATTWAIHVLNVFLLAKLLEERTGDARAAAFGALAFGLTTQYREVFWWAELGGLAVCFTISVGGFLALERYRKFGGGAWLAAASVATFTAPMAFGSGLSLGPVLAAEAWLLLPGERRRRGAAAIAVAWLAYLALYRSFAGHGSTSLLPRSASELAVAARFVVDFVGTGVVSRILCSVDDAPGALSAVLALIYAALVGALAFALPAKERVRLLLAQLYLAAIVAPIALTRWSFASHNATASRYQYLTAIAWTTALALAFAAALRRAPRRAPIAAVLGLVALGAGHVLASRGDHLAYSPAARASHPVLLSHLVLATRRAREPMYDAALPAAFAHPSTRAAVLVAIVAPETTIAFTNARTPASLAPYLEDPVLFPLVGRGR
jgi:hypothetical protein